MRSSRLDSESGLNARRVSTLKPAYPAGWQPTLRIRLPRMGHPLVEEPLQASVRVLTPPGAKEWSGSISTLGPEELLARGIRRRLPLEQVPPGEYLVVVTFRGPEGKALAHRESHLILHEPWD